jgi:hypothetical protein
MITVTSIKESIMRLRALTLPFITALSIAAIAIPATASAQLYGYDDDPNNRFGIDRSGRPAAGIPGTGPNGGVFPGYGYQQPYGYSSYPAQSYPNPYGYGGSYPNAPTYVLGRNGQGARELDTGGMPPAPSRAPVGYQWGCQRMADGSWQNCGYYHTGKGEKTRLVVAGAIIMLALAAR